MILKDPAKKKRKEPIPGFDHRPLGSYSGAWALL
jgi:hypothetical protein